MKNILLIGLLILAVLFVGIAIGYTNPDKVKNVTDTLGGGWLPSAEVLAGSSTALCLMPPIAVFADATTTASDLHGCTIDQVVDSEKKDTVLLNMMVRGRTVTSTFFVRQMGSHDGTNYFDLATSTYSLAGMGPGDGLRTVTSTIISLSPSGFQFDPGVATTSISVPLQTTGYRYTRFVMYGDDIAADPTDGILAWINAIKVDPLTR